MFVGVYFFESAILCFFFILRELIFAIEKDWFFLLGTEFCDFQEVTFNWNIGITKCRDV